MEFVNTILFGAGFDIYNISVVGCAIVAGICILCAIVAAIIRCQVVYVDPEGDYEIGFEKKSWLSKVVVRPATKEGKVFIGWSLDAEGTNLISEPEFLLTHTVVLYAVWADEEDVANAKSKAEGVFVQFNYMDSNYEDIIKTNSTRFNCVLPENQDIPVKVDGWCFEKGGYTVLEGEDVSAVFAINLYPIFDQDAKPTYKKLNTSAVVELLFLDADTDKYIYKESHYVTIAPPENYSDDQTFVGWGVEPNGEAIIEKNAVDSVFTIQLYSVGKAKEEAAEEVAAETVAPVVEEVIEEVAEDVAEAEELVVEYIQEEIIEEPMPKVEEVVSSEPDVEIVDDAPVEETVVEEVGEVVPTIIPTYFDNEGNKIEIKYSRSFTANLIQSDETVKDYYSQLKNHILSYKGVKTKISWKFDSYNRGRDQLFKIKLRGKTICVYCALDPEEFDKSKYHHDAIDAKIFADVPMLLKIKSGLGLRKAKEIVDIVMAKFGIEPDPKAKNVDYVAEYPYAETEDLLSRKLVKALEADSSVIVKSSKAKDDDEE